jgi:hypothetical protein
MRAAIANHLEADAISFVDFLARQLPREARSRHAQSSIIIPGR